MESILTEQFKSHNLLALFQYDYALKLGTMLNSFFLSRYNTNTTKPRIKITNEDKHSMIMV